MAGHVPDGQALQRPGAWYPTTWKRPSYILKPLFSAAQWLLGF